MASPALDSDASLIGSFITAAAAYEQRLGGATRFLGRLLMPLIMPLPPNCAILDNACGTGIMTEEILRSNPSVKITSTDSSEGMISIINKKISTYGWELQVQAGLLDGQNLKGLSDHTFDVSITNLGLFYFPDPVAGAREIKRTLKPGGMAIATCWKETASISVLYEAQKIVKPKVPWAGLPVFDKWNDGKMMERCMRQGGFEDVQILEMESVFSAEQGSCGSTEEALVKAMVENMKSFIPAGSWSEEELERLGSAVATVMREQGDKWRVEIDGKNGVRWVAWVAIARS